jgi:hypothetical protein
MLYMMTDNEFRGEPKARGIRAITATEVDELHQRGWVKLPALLCAERAAELLAQAKHLARSKERRDARMSAAAAPDTILYPSDSDTLFAALAHDTNLGEAARVLLGYNGGMRLWGDALGVVAPRTELPAAARHWHQDAGKLPLDRASISLWIALDEITPDQGPLRFREGSHRLGPLGTLDGDASTAAWVRLSACPVSPAGRLMPGDATAHLSLTVLAALDNESERTVWPYSLKYFPDGSRFTGLPAARTAGLGLEPGTVIKHERFPITTSWGSR